MSFNFGNTTTSAPSFGSTTGFTFGNASAPASTTAFSFGTTTTAPSSTGFSFGAPTTSVAPFSFSGMPAITTASSFNFGGFGNTAPSSTSGFSFGQQASSLGGNNFFSTSSAVQPTGTFGMGTTTQPQQPIDNQTCLVSALNPQLFGDERDIIIRNWNNLQAHWGVGKGYYGQNLPPAEFTSNNAFCAFKAVGYNCLPSVKAEDSLVSITFNKKDKEIISQQQQLIDALHKCFGSKPTISVVIDGIKAIQDDRTEVVFYLLERLQTGLTKRVAPVEVCGYLEQPTVKPQVTNMGVVNVVPKMPLSKEQLQQYLDNIPAGLQPTVWQQAKLDNPDPGKLIPVPLVGFQDLYNRMKKQDYETKQHQKRLDMISDDLGDLQNKHNTTVAKVAEQKRKLGELQHRILKVLVQQEIMRKAGYAIQADEEQLRTKLEAIQAELSAPTQFKGHLKELTSQIRMQNYQTSTLEGEKYSIDEISKEEIKEQLLSQQEGISLLINIIKDDLADLKTIEEIIREENIRRQ